MKTKQKELEDLFTDYTKHDFIGGMNFITGLYIGMNERLIIMNEDYVDGDEKKNIKIKGGYRDITIHQHQDDEDEKKEN